MVPGIQVIPPPCSIASLLGQVSARFARTRRRQPAPLELAGPGSRDSKPGTSMASPPTPTMT